MNSHTLKIVAITLAIISDFALTVYVSKPLSGLTFLSMASNVLSYFGFSSVFLLNFRRQITYTLFGVFIGVTFVLKVTLFNTQDALIGIAFVTVPILWGLLWVIFSAVVIISRVLVAKTSKYL
jgi:hypothetical protein